MPSRSPEDVLAKQARQDARRERNRVAAQNSRDRKLQDFQRLADDNTALREEVAELRHRLAAYEGTGSGAGGAGGGGRAGAGNGNGAGAGAGPSNGSGMGSAGKRKRILTKPLHKKVAAARKWEDDEDDEDEDEDELFDLDEAPRSSPRPDDSVFGISRAGSTLTGLKVSFLVSSRWFSEGCSPCLLDGADVAPNVSPGRVAARLSTARQWARLGWLHQVSIRLKPSSSPRTKTPKPSDSPTLDLQTPTMTASASAHSRRLPKKGRTRSSARSASSTPHCPAPRVAATASSVQKLRYNALGISSSAAAPLRTRLGS